jgi:hypothetical protein
MTSISEDNITKIIDICNKTPYKLREELKYTHYKIEPEFKLLDNIIIQYQVIRKKLNPKSNIPLYVTVGLSYNSFCNNLIILNNNIDKIKDKYSEIIFFVSNIKDQYKDFINTMKTNDKFEKYYSDEDKTYAITDVMKEIVATHYDKIIRKMNKDLNYDEIDVLGVSFGGGVFVSLAELNSIKIKNLILMAPGIGIFKGFEDVSLDQNIILGWCIQDNKVSYKKIGTKLIKELHRFHNKIVVLTDLGGEDNEDITHRLQDGIFDAII